MILESKHFEVLTIFYCCLALETAVLRQHYDQEVARREVKIACTFISHWGEKEEELTPLFTVREMSHIQNTAI